MIGQKKNGGRNVGNGKGCKYPTIYVYGNGIKLFLIEKTISLSWDDSLLRVVYFNVGVDKSEKLEGQTFERLRTFNTYQIYNS